MLMYSYIKFDFFLKSNFAVENWWKASETEIKLSTPPDSQPKEDSLWLTPEQVAKLTPEQKDKYEKIITRIKELEKELEQVKAWVQVVWWRRDNLEQKSKENISHSELPEQWAYDINERIIQLNGELWTLQEQRDVLIRSIELVKYNKLSDSELKQMQKISPKEFLSYPSQERLKFITKWNVEAKDIKKWWTESLEFTFTYDGQFNRELYQRTTAWQTLPDTVRVVKSDGIEYTRIWINGEFFTQEWKRLIIHEWTQVDVIEHGDENTMKKLSETILASVKEYEWKSNYELALEATKKWYDPKFIIALFWDKINQVSQWRKENIEDLLGDIARCQDDFWEDYPNEPTLKDGKMTEKFAWYVINTFQTGKEQEISTLYWYNIDTLRSARRVNNPSLWGWPMKMENINIDGVTEQEVKNILAMKKFLPWSREAQILFHAACQAADLPVEWAKSENLHYVLSRESNGIVGRLNYTIKWETVDSFKNKATSSTGNNPIGAKSTASWLGQLLLSNVDKFYPNGRDWIWDALNEAVWMLRYIKDRYGNPDICRSMYGTTGNYVHPTKWPQTKWFKEWY